MGRSDVGLGHEEDVRGLAGEVPLDKLLHLCSTSDYESNQKVVSADRKLVRKGGRLALLRVQVVVYPVDDADGEPVLAKEAVGIHDDPKDLRQVDDGKIYGETPFQPV